MQPRMDGSHRSPNKLNETGLPKKLKETQKRAEGRVTIFHLDTCWDKNLHYFKELPKGSAVIGLDSTTDILLAKKILGGHLCIYGDIPAAMLSHGTPEEVEAYCKKLIDEVGRDGGFILGSGCAVPPDCKPDNFRMMLETAKHYEFSM